MVNTSKQPIWENQRVEDPLDENPPVVIHLEMGEAYDSPTNSSTNTKDEMIHEGMREVITHKYRGSQQFSRVEYSTQI